MVKLWHDKKYQIQIIQNIINMKQAWQPEKFMYLNKHNFCNYSLFIKNDSCVEQLLWYSKIDPANKDASPPIVAIWMQSHRHCAGTLFLFVSECCNICLLQNRCSSDICLIYYICALYLNQDGSHSKGINFKSILLNANLCIVSKFHFNNTILGLTDEKSSLV